VPSPADVTVITPTVRGRERLLAECRASVAALGLPHLVAVDELGDGPGATRNWLLLNVGTEWVLPVDDDDLLLPNYLDAVGPHLAGADVVYTSWELRGAEEPAPISRWDPNLLPYRNFIPVTACVRVGLLRQVGGYCEDVALAEDWLLWLELLDRRARFTFVDEVAWVYRRHAGGRNGAPLLPDQEDPEMAMMTNDEPVFGPDGTKILDAGSRILDDHEIVKAQPGAFRPLGTAVDEDTSRTSAVAANPDLLADDAPSNDARSGGGDDPVSTPQGNAGPDRVRDTSAQSAPAPKQDGGKATKTEPGSK
jgi:hypothetical protein